VRLAKTTRPSTAKAYPRTRLFRLIDRGADRPITWVWGPPGAGKTTLVASYLSARRTRSLWYQVDDGDADVARLLYYLGRAAPRAGRHRALPVLLPEHRATLPTFVRRFSRELYARLGSRFVLVLDNFQEMPATSAFADVVEVALSELPPGGRAIVISRTAPPGRFARLRANQAMHVLGWSDLQLTLRETAQVTRSVSRRRLGRRALEALHASAGGWAAGVVLLIEEARGGDISSTTSPRRSSPAPTRSRGTCCSPPHG
jgi:ATP/maltotriose-dependent transcriptional regulator MalT